MQTSKPPMPTTTAHAARLCLFQPTRRPRQLKQHEIATPWGKVLLTGRLGQQHADFFEALCFERERRVDFEDGRIKLLVDPAAVRRRARIASGQEFTEIKTELQAAVIQILEPTRFACSGHLVDHIDEAKRDDGSFLTRPNPLGGDRRLWRVDVGKALCRLVAGDIWLGYDPRPIAAIGCGIAQAVARHALTHEREPRGGWTLDGLIHAVRPGTQTDAAMRKARHQIREAAEALQTAGVTVDGDRVHLSVPQTPGGVPQTPDSVPQTPGAFPKRPAVADTYLDTSLDRPAQRRA